ncbi:hypothetical protein [Clostridium chauvoei]|uniref:Uncharacterized protein n=2 Tax=Clostridium chauvoei TaxID=46867 RepID=A0A1U6JPW2_9CLOT|nr:hypothetical protein [Clostridium chauvoei]ATD55975.1 hypothetical protein BTM20_12390 [Clostridium chauvoei]ATD56355.1 hypothetical protein BTM21_00625 [Clostridium chauvoei]MBX7280873.1 hypothetical protein [Clostridium chauvoei]MBX7283356.1 hypothetical protein [Clostridium chauvoei]MBX7285961.1 hypothetical protein [Clostridium chauvoei]
MGKLIITPKGIFRMFYWQDIERSNIFIRILNLIFAIVLSFGAYSTVYLSNMNIILKIIIGSYLIVNIMSYWPTEYLLDEKNKVVSATFFIFQNNFILFSFIILLRYVLKEQKLLL